MLRASFLLCWLCFIAVPVALEGCADNRAKSDVRAHESKMAALSPDMTAEQVTNLMGPPDKIVMQQGKNNEAVVTYLYITQYVEPDTSRGGTKQLHSVIIINERLSGWGWHHLDKPAKPYEVDLRTTPFLAPGP